MPTRPVKDIYTSQASEVDARMSAAIKAANELQRKTQEIDKQRQGSIQVYHQRKSELKEFLAGLYTDSGNHVVIPSGEIVNEMKKKTDKKTRRRRGDVRPSKQPKRHQTTAAKFLSISGAGGFNALGLQMSDDDTESSSGDDSDFSENTQSDGNIDRNKKNGRENEDGDDEDYSKTRELAVPKLPKIINHNAQRKTVPHMKMERKFDIAKFRRRFGNFSRNVVHDGSDFARNNIEYEDDNRLRPPPLTRSTLSTLDSKPTELRAKIQQWCDSINEDWFYNKDDDVKSKNSQIDRETVMKSESDKKGNPNHQDVKTGESQFLRLPSSPFSRSNSRQRSPLPPSSQSRSRRSSHGDLPRNLRVNDKSKAATDDDDPCDIELVDGGFGLVGTRVVKKTSLPVSRLIKDSDRAGDHLVPGYRNTTHHIDKRVHFAFNGEINNVPTTRMSAISRPKTQGRSKSDSGVELDNLEFEVKLAMRNSSDVNEDDMHRIKRCHHSFHECKVYRGRDRTMSLADPLTLDRMAQAQIRVVQRQRARMRRESSSYSASASNDAALRYNQMKWSM